MDYVKNALSRILVILHIFTLVNNWSKNNVVTYWPSPINTPQSPHQIPASMSRLNMINTRIFSLMNIEFLRQMICVRVRTLPGQVSFSLCANFQKKSHWARAVETFKLWPNFESFYSQWPKRFIVENWHTKSQGNKKKCPHYIRRRVRPCPSHTAGNMGAIGKDTCPGCVLVLPCIHTLRSNILRPTFHCMK